MDEFKDLAFTASDFTSAPTGNCNPAKMADWCNKKLFRKLEKAPVVCSQEGPNPSTWDRANTWQGSHGKVITYTHTARLVCIEVTK